MQNTTGVTGAHTTDGIPHGYTTLTPFIALADARGAIEFYRTVFGARLVSSTQMGGVVSHADLDFGVGHLQLGEASPDYHLVTPPAGDDDCYSLAFYCADADAVVTAAEAAGAIVREPLSNFVSGDRFASIRDPWGVRWSIMSRIEDLSPAESDRRVEEWAASLGG
ncbi:MAG: VOC family protein [Protaetiibacter sp.]